RLEGDPAFEDAVALRRLLARSDPPVRRLGGGKLRLQHVAHLIAAFDGLDVPGEGDEVAPVALLGEKADGIVDPAGGKGRAERIEKRLDAGGGGFLEHRFSSCSVGKRDGSSTVPQNGPAYRV